MPTLLIPQNLFPSPRRLKTPETDKMAFFTTCLQPRLPSKEFYLTLQPKLPVSFPQQTNLNNSWGNAYSTDCVQASAL